MNSFTRADINFPFRRQFFVTHDKTIHLNNIDPSKNHMIKMKQKAKFDFSPGTHNGNGMLQILEGIQHWIPYIGRQRNMSIWQS